MCRATFFLAFALATGLRALVAGLQCSDTLVTGTPYDSVVFDATCADAGPGSATCASSECRLCYNNCRKSMQGTGCVSCKMLEHSYPLHVGHLVGQWRTVAVYPSASSPGTCSNFVVSAAGDFNLTLASATSQATLFAPAPSDFTAGSCTRHGVKLPIYLELDDGNSVKPVVLRLFRQLLVLSTATEVIAFVAADATGLSHKFIRKIFKAMTAVPMDDVAFLDGTTCTPVSVSDPTFGICGGHRRALSPMVLGLGSDSAA